MKPRIFTSGLASFTLALTAGCLAFPSAAQADTFYWDNKNATTISYTLTPGSPAKNFVRLKVRRTGPVNHSSPSPPGPSTRRAFESRISKGATK